MFKHSVSNYYKYSRYSTYKYHLEKYKDLLFYENLSEIISSSLNTESAKLISFSKYLNFNDTKVKIKKRLGKPRYQIVNTKNKNVVIFFYKIRIGKEKIKCDIHFYKNSMFLFRYHLSGINNKEYKVLYSILKNKYDLSKDCPFPSKIRDIKNNVLIISKDVGVSLNYVNTSHQFFHLLHSIQEKKMHGELNNSGKLKRFFNSL